MLLHIYPRNRLSYTNNSESRYVVQEFSEHANPIHTHTHARALKITQINRKPLKDNAYVSGATPATVGSPKKTANNSQRTNV